MTGAVWFLHAPDSGRDRWLVQGMTGRGTDTLATLQLSGAARALPDEVRERIVRDLRDALAAAVHAGGAPERTEDLLGSAGRNGRTE